MAKKTPDSSSVSDFLVSVDIKGKIFDIPERDLVRSLAGTKEGVNHLKSLRGGPDDAAGYNLYEKYFGQGEKGKPRSDFGTRASIEQARLIPGIAQLFEKGKASKEVASYRRSSLLEDANKHTELPNNINKGKAVKNLASVFPDAHANFLNPSQPHGKPTGETGARHYADSVQNIVFPKKETLQQKGFDRAQLREIRNASPESKQQLINTFEKQNKLRDFEKGYNKESGPRISSLEQKRAEFQAAYDKDIHKMGPNSQAHFDKASSGKWYNSPLDPAINKFKEVMAQTTQKFKDTFLKKAPSGSPLGIMEKLTHGGTTGGGMGGRGVGGGSTHAADHAAGRGGLAGQIAGQFKHAAIWQAYAPVLGALGAVGQKYMRSA